MYYNKTLQILGVLLVCITSPALAENIDPYDNDSQYAYGENIGWTNFGLADYYVVACKVTFEDLANFVDDWLDSGPAPADLDGESDDVDFEDFAIFSSYWQDFCTDGWPLK